MAVQNLFATIRSYTGESDEQIEARLLRETQERFGKNYLRIKLDCTLLYQEAGDEYWLRSNGEENIEVYQPDGSWVPATLTDPDGEHPGISIKFSARPGSGNYNFGNYARMAKLANEQGMVHGPIPSAGEIENAPSGRLRDRGFFAKCPSCGYTKR
jgi:hypothetical protein